MKFSKTSRLLLFTNLVTGILLLALIWKEDYLGRITGHFRNQRMIPFEPPDFFEQTDYQTLYKSNASIVMIGNSLTFRMHWNELLNRTNVVNRGINTDLTRGMVSRLNHVIDVHPKICFIEGGVNDIYEGLPKDTVIKNLGIMIEELKKHQIIPVINAVIHLGKKFKNSAEVNGRISELNKEIAKMAVTWNVSVIDINPAVSENGMLRDEYVQDDAIHLTSKAYLVWKQEIEKILGKEKI